MPPGTIKLLLLRTRTPTFLGVGPMLWAEGNQLHFRLVPIVLCTFSLAYPALIRSFCTLGRLIALSIGERYGVGTCTPDNPASSTVDDSQGLAAPEGCTEECRSFLGLLMTYSFQNFGLSLVLVSLVCIFVAMVPFTSEDVLVDNPAEAMERYKVIKELGDGTYGSVWKALNHQTNEIAKLETMHTVSVHQDVST
eukprot:Gb_16832 [translate_table: standard]